MKMLAPQHCTAKRQTTPEKINRNKVNFGISKVLDKLIPKQSIVYELRIFYMNWLSCYSELLLNSCYGNCQNASLCTTLLQVNFA